jgi:hypothetical protein
MARSKKGKFNIRVKQEEQGVFDREDNAEDNDMHSNDKPPLNAQKQKSIGEETTSTKRCKNEPSMSMSHRRAARPHIKVLHCEIS